MHEANHFPEEWRPQCTILEGMFLIIKAPVGSHATFQDYAHVLMKRFIMIIMTQFAKGSSEVHVIFDNPGRLENTPKFFKHKRRDAATVTEGHV